MNARYEITITIFAEDVSESNIIAVMDNVLNNLDENMIVEDIKCKEIG